MKFLQNWFSKKCNKASFQNPVQIYKRLQNAQQQYPPLQTRYSSYDLQFAKKVQQQQKTFKMPSLPSFFRAWKKYLKQHPYYIQTTSYIQINKMNINEQKLAFRGFICRWWINCHTNVLWVNNNHSNNNSISCQLPNWDILNNKKIVFYETNGEVNCGWKIVVIIITTINPQE